MKRFTLILSLMVAMVTTAMAQKAHQRVSHEGWVVTALNEADYASNGKEGGVNYIADDNPATFYHSNWSSNYDDGNGVNKGKDGLQAFMVELPTSLDDLSLITYKGRSDNNGSGWARGVRVYVFETLPTDWPAGGLSSLGYADKQALLASTNENLGTAAFDNTGKPWANDRTQKLVEFATPQKGQYVLFIMESGSDAWLTCSDFQIYQLKEYTAIKEDNPYYLQVTNAKAEGTLFVDTKTANSDTSGPTIGVSTTTVETYFDWNENGWFIKDTEGKYIGVSKWCAGPQQETGYEWHLLVNDDNTLNLLQTTYDGEGDNSRCFLGGDVTTDANVTKLYTNCEKGNAINVKLIDANAVPVTVKYVFTWNGVEKGTQTTETFGGELYPEVEFELPYGVVVETMPAGEIDATEAEEVEGVKTITKTIVLENTLPFVYADKYESIENWYYLQFHANNKNYLYYDGTANVLDASKTAVDMSQRDNYTWGFIGDPFTGFTVVNRAAGESKALNAGESGAIVGDEAQVMKLTASSHGENGFFMQSSSGDYTQRFNKQNNKVVYWSGADAGSTFMVVKRPSEEEEQKALVAEFKTRAIEGLGCVGGYAADKADAINAINTYAEMETFKAGNEVITFDGNKFYRIKNVFRKTFIDIDNNNRVLRDEDHADIDQLWQVEAGTDGAYFIKSPNAGYMQAVGNNELVAETDAQFVISSFYEGAGQFGIISKGTNNMLAGINASALGTWWNGVIDSDMSYRFIEANDVEITLSDINDEGWATTYLPFDVTLSEGLTAYYVNEINTGYVTFAVTTDVPANNGVILRGEPGEYTLNIAKASSTITGNYLSGTTVTKEITKEDGNAYYVLAKHAEAGLGFYNAVLGEDATKFKNVANKAYLMVPAEQAQGVKSYSFRFEGEGTTGIGEVKTENGEVKAIYDLTGRRVEVITAPGIYIINGKKTLVK